MRGEKYPKLRNTFIRGKESVRGEKNVTEGRCTEEHEVKEGRQSKLRTHEYEGKGECKGRVEGLRGVGQGERDVKGGRGDEINLRM